MVIYSILSTKSTRALELSVLIVIVLKLNLNTFMQVTRLHDYEELQLGLKN